MGKKFLHKHLHKAHLRVKTKEEGWNPAIDEVIGGSETGECLPAECRGWAEIRDIAGCMSRKVEAMLPADKSMYYTITNNKTTKMGGWAKFLYTIISKDADLKGGQAPSYFIRICVPVIDDDSAPPYIDEKCPMDPCKKRTEGDGCTTPLTGQQQDMINNDIEENITLNPTAEEEAK